MSLSNFSRLAILALAALAAPAALAQTSTMAPTTTVTKTVTKPNGITITKVPAKEKFTTIAAAQATCPTDTVVWSSFTSTHSFHTSTSKYFGKTKHGAYLCKQTALAAGYHQSKT